MTLTRLLAILRDAPPDAHLDMAAFDALRRRLDRQGASPHGKAPLCGNPTPCSGSDPLPPLEVFLIGRLALLWTWRVACVELRDMQTAPTAPTPMCADPWVLLDCRSWRIRQRPDPSETFVNIYNNPLPPPTPAQISLILATEEHTYGREPENSPPITSPVAVAPKESRGC